jgi:nucleoside-diphosphate-sugar epimerase
MVTGSTDSIDSVVFGAAGFIGRSLVAELLRQGRRVAAAVRGPGDRLTIWLAAQEVDTAGLTVVTADITAPGLGVEGLKDLEEVRDVYNTAARFAFGLSVEEARSANVTGALNVVDWAATRPGLRRLVHISGYRVAGGPVDYRREGAYEASKKSGRCSGAGPRSGRGPLRPGLSLRSVRGRLSSPSVRRQVRTSGTGEAQALPAQELMA